MALPFVVGGGGVGGGGGQSVMNDVTTQAPVSIGDFVSFYSPEGGGYLYNRQAGIQFNTLAVSRDPDQIYPNLPNPHVAVFKICVANRYKLDKQFRKLQEQSKADADDVSLKAKLNEAELAAQAESEGNMSEQKRLQGKPLTYGATIQLQHQFSHRYVHVNTNRTSRTSSSDMMVELLPHSSKSAHFRIMPRYKVKSEGDIVRYDDQIVLESVKSVGQYLKVSSLPLKRLISPEAGKLEVNLSVRQSGLKIYQFSKADTGISEKYLVAGSTIRLFHKELEAYLVAEGLFDWADTQGTHLRVREVDPTSPKTMSPSTSAITYWQLELEEGPLRGDPIKWESQLRFRSMVTRKYLSISPEKNFFMTKNGKDPSTVWRITPVIGDDLYVDGDSYARFEHVVTGLWLHAMPNDFVKKGRVQGPEAAQGAKKAKGGTTADLEWDKALCKVLGTSPTMQYDDAFTLQVVTEEQLKIFNFAAGCVPLLQKFVQEKSNGVQLNEEACLRICHLLDNLKDFMFENGIPRKPRQKLLRNLMIVELLIAVLRLDVLNSPDQKFLTRIFVKCYDVLDTYLLGDSRKNELYIAGHMEFFLTQISFQGEIGIYATTMVTELIRDNRQIVDRMQNHHIDSFIQLLFKNQNYRYLDLLNVLCVCDGVSLSDNQNYICKKWLVDTFETNQSCCFLTETGARLNRQKKTQIYDKTMTYVSTNNGSTWKSLLDIIQEEQDNERVLFLTHQLDLFEKLSSGRNDYCNKIITTTLDYLTWEEAFMCMSDERLPPDLRAKYCSLIIVLFVDFGENYSVVDRVQLTFAYSHLDGGMQRVRTWAREGARERAMSLAADSDDAVSIDSVDSNRSPEELFQHNVARIRSWIEKFLDKCQCQVASDIGYNQMVRQVLRMVWYLVAFGYYSEQKVIQKLILALISIMDGSGDLPYPESHLKRLNPIDREKVISKFRSTERFQQKEENNPIAESKQQAMEILDLVFNIRFNNRMSLFLYLFKQMHAAMKGVKGGRNKELIPLLSADFDIMKDNNTAGRAKAALARLIADTAMLKDGGANMREILLDLSNYEYEDMVTMSMHLLTRYYSAHEILFERAINAQVVVNESSVALFNEISDKLPILRRLTTSKLTDEQVGIILPLLDYIRDVSMIDRESQEAHRMNQNILYNQDVVGDIFDILNQKVETALLMESEGLQQVRQKSFLALKALAHDNPVIQNRLYDRMFELLNVQGADKELAMALVEIFTNNKNNCLKCPKQFIRKVMVALSTRKEPAFLVLLQAIVKVEEINLPIKGNQNSVMKFFMEHREVIAPMLDGSRNLHTLIKQTTAEEQEYLVHLVDLFSTCAEGENRFIESLCQTVFQVDELLDLLTDASMSPSVKKAFLRFLLWVYLNTGGGDEVEVDFREDIRIWAFIKLITKDLEELTGSLNTDPNLSLYVKREPKFTSVTDKSNHWAVYYMFEAVCPFCEVYFKDFYEKGKGQPEQIQLVTDLAMALRDFTNITMPYVNTQNRFKVLIKSTGLILGKSTVAPQVIKAFNNQYGKSKITSEFVSEARKRYELEFSGEEEINERLNQFTKNMKKCYGGVNTVQAQIGHPSDREYTEQLDEGGDEELPLGEEFQVLLACYSGDRPSKLLDALWIQDHKVYSTEKSRVDAARLDIKCLKLLRALVHNKERRLPENWESDVKASELTLEDLASMQNMLNDMGAVEKTLGLLAKPNQDVVRETLAFLAAMLFNGNQKTQDQFMHFFLGTREETFFFSIKTRMNASAVATKEKKSLMSQYEAKVSDALKLMKNLQAVRDLAKSRASMGSKFRLGSRAQLQKSMRELRESSVNLRRQSVQQNSQRNGVYASEQNGVNTSPDGYLSIDQIKQVNMNGVGLATTDGGSPDEMVSVRIVVPGIDNKVHPMPSTVGFTYDPNNREMTPPIINEDDDQFDDAVFDILSATSDDGYIELILKMLSLMCDGQHNGIQNYLREQPDNIKSFNLIAETCVFLQILYSNINRVNISLVAGVFSTLLEMCSGNFANQVICFDNKVVECVNHVIRFFKFEGCLLEEVLDMKKTITELLTALIEESNDVNKSNVEEIKESLDQVAIYDNVIACYRLVHENDLDYLMEMGAADKADVEENKEEIIQLGFNFYHLLIRLQDIHGPDPLPSSEIAKIQHKTMFNDAIDYFDCKSMSIEILKDGHLQKISFRVKSLDVLREDVKEMMKWEVDRSSPSNKIRDFVAWSKDIMNDIKYQTRIMSNPVAAFLITHSNLWHNFVLLVTFILNLFILFTWDAPTDVDKIRPEYPDWYMYVLLILGIVHVVLSLVILIEYFLSNRPQLPSRHEIKSFFAHILGIAYFVKAPEDDNDDEHLRVNFFSLKTFYYLLFLASSVSGCVFWGYFFCFHMLHIVPRNQMLMRVLKSVTQNGSSLIWVGILGLVIIWIYAVASFAFVRYAFTGENGLYCENMGQCFVTSIRYGVLEGIHNHILVPEEYQDFQHYAIRNLYDVSFFIIFVTILMNIIFGIIVDTFSELRDLKWQTEEDMNSKCFICSRSSYDFEHYGKGFDYHVKKEHNMWAYLFYFIHLDDTRKNDYTALDLYVYRLLSKENYEFFPVNRALVLDDEGDEVEAKLDKLQVSINKLLVRQEEMELLEIKRQQKERRDEFKAKNLKGKVSFSLPGEQQPGTSGGGGAVGTVTAGVRQFSRGNNNNINNNNNSNNNNNNNRNTPTGNPNSQKGSRGQ
ncbi:inositol 1,4,5-trisphosphate-gated calcium channel ITPR2-like isoform X3 [Convolutriloba macropyga]|uniref:inositol 1,4,5-trisphosphate-gated calcium channel ITPR2-like isoform X3 n=1 Tax=Convolutriloba macropyga TaxID=536237 RepID=UPI003F527003